MLMKRAKCTNNKKIKKLGYSQALFVMGDHGSVEYRKLQMYAY
jgi:hypothetical protein